MTLGLCVSRWHAFSMDVSVQIVHELVSGIRPWDHLETEHRAETLNWLEKTKRRVQASETGDARQTPGLICCHGRPRRWQYPAGQRRSTHNVHRRRRATCHRSGTPISGPRNAALRDVIARGREPSARGAARRQRRRPRRSGARPRPALHPPRSGGRDHIALPGLGVHHGLANCLSRAVGHHVLLRVACFRSSPACAPAPRHHSARQAALSGR